MNRIALVLMAAATAAQPAQARERAARSVTPYIELDQVVIADLSRGGGDVLTYSTVAAGVDASIATRRAEGQISLRYERTFGYDDDYADTDTLSGLARGSYRASRELSLEAGALAARTRQDGGSAPVGASFSAPDTLTQVYSAYAGPTLSTQIGDVTATAAYRVGYTKIEEREDGAATPGVRPYDLFDDSVSHVASASIGQQPGSLPIGWSVGANYSREDSGQLDQRLEAASVRGDVTVPVSGSLAAVAGIGYEKIEASERDALRNAAGVPIVGADGRLQVDPASPRLLAYEQDGIIWDVGVMWRPSRRTSLAAYVGERYDSMTYTGSFSWEPDQDMQFGVVAYDQVTGFGQFVSDSLSRLPTSFTSNRNPLTGQLQGCAFAGTGTVCFNNLLQGASSASFRNRGVTASYSVSRFGWDTGIALGYSQRRFFAAQSGGRAALDGSEDENLFADWFLGRQLDARSSFGTNVYANLYRPALLPEILSVGGNANYNRTLWRGLDATAAVAVDHSESDGAEDLTTASALLGLRYSF